MPPPADGGAGTDDWAVSFDCHDEYDEYEYLFEAAEPHSPAAPRSLAASPGPATPESVTTAPAHLVMASLGKTSTAEVAELLALPKAYPSSLSLTSRASASTVDTAGRTVSSRGTDVSLASFLASSTSLASPAVGSATSRPYTPYTRSQLTPPSSSPRRAASTRCQSQWIIRCVARATRFGAPFLFKLCAGPRAPLPLSLLPRSSHYLPSLASSSRSSADASTRCTSCRSYVSQHGTHQTPRVIARECYGSNNDLALSSGALSSLERQRTAIALGGWRIIQRGGFLARSVRRGSRHPNSPTGPPSPRGPPPYYAPVYVSTHQRTTHRATISR